MCPGRHLSYSCIHSLVQHFFFFFLRIFCALGTVLAIVCSVVNKTDIIMAALMEAQRLAEKAYTEDIHR